jgi:hypothetical protein
MSRFRYKWMSSDSVCFNLEETDEEYVFRISKALVAHEPFDAKNWRVERIEKNKMLLIGSKHFPCD